MSEWEKVYYAYKKAKYENILKNLQKPIDKPPKV